MSAPPISRSKRRRATLDGSTDAKEEGKRALYHCNYCQRNISDGVRIKCAVCMDFDLCVECFSVGVELGEHKNTHSYRVMDYLAFPLFEPHWGADEELLLLEAIDTFGIGNWQAIADHVGEKEASECKAHYLRTYMESAEAPQPGTAPSLKGLDIRGLMKRPVDPCCPPEKRPKAAADISKPAIATVASHTNIAEAPAASAAAVEVAAEVEPSGQDGEGGRRKRGRGGSRASSRVTLVPVASPGEAHEEEASAVDSDVMDATDVATGGTTPAGGGGGDIGEVSDGAVAAAAGLQSTEADAKERPAAAKGGSRVRDTAKHEATGYLKLRDEFDPEYDAEAELPIADLDFLPTDTDELRQAKLHILEIYNERLREREARREIVKEKGLTDIRRLQAAEKRRGPYERRVYASMRVFERYQSMSDADALCQGLYLEQQLRGRIEGLKALRRIGARTFLQGEMLQEERKRREAMAAGRPSGRPERNRAPPAEPSLLPAPSTALGPVHVGAGPHAGKPIVVPTWKGRRPGSLEISQMPGVEVLSEKERDVCSSHRFVPAHWLLLKETLMREVARHGPLSRSDAKSLFRLEPARATKLHDLAISQGWVPAKGNAAAVDAKRDEDA